MNLEEFIRAVFLRYPPKNTDEEYHTVGDCIQEYKTALSKSFDTYDYKAALEDIISNYNPKYPDSPSVPILKEFLKGHILKRNAKYKKFQSIWADRNGYTYEFGIEINPEQTEKELKLMGFTNIRLTREQNTLQKEGDKKWVQN